jgi:hypothetical protein
MSSNTKAQTLSSSLSSPPSSSHHGVFGDVYTILKDIDLLPNSNIHFRFQLPHQAQVVTPHLLYSISFLIIINY